MTRTNLFLIGGSIAGLLVLLCACESLGPYAPRSSATIPGATYVGADTCAGCHEKAGKEFPMTSHGRRALGEQQGEGCESCHGPGSLHVDGGGDVTKILKGNSDVCLSCHTAQKAQFSLQYHHPVPEGKMACTACHDVHSTKPQYVFSDEINDKCVQCHKQQRGPWTFEHEALKDGCTVCHSPHGSINTRLLVERDYNLCLKCHYSGLQYQSVGHYAHRRALNPISVQGPRGTTCLGCHRAVHGSNFSKELRAE